MIDTKDDILIAKFLGWEFVDVSIVTSSTYNVWRITSDDMLLYPKGMLVYPPLLFKVDFNWLMSVVQKLEQGDLGFKLCRKRVEVYVDSTKEVLIDIKLGSRLESLYAAVVKYLKEYQSCNNS